MADISNHDDVIDSRDVIARIEALEEEQANAMGEWEGLSELDKPADMVAFETDGRSEELDTLCKLQAQAEDYSDDWHHGATLIRESYFKDYAQELAEDCGMIQANATWPNTCIDWDQAARELQMDYTSVEFDGVTYYIR